MVHPFVKSARKAQVKEKARNVILNNLEDIPNQNLDRNELATCRDEIMKSVNDISILCINLLAINLKDLEHDPDALAILQNAVNMFKQFKWEVNQTIVLPLQNQENLYKKAKTIQLSNCETISNQVTEIKPDPEDPVILENGYYVNQNDNSSLNEVKLDHNYNSLTQDHVLDQEVDYLVKCEIENDIIDDPVQQEYGYAGNVKEIETKRKRRKQELTVRSEFGDNSCSVSIVSNHQPNSQCLPFQPDFKSQCNEMFNTIKGGKKPNKHKKANKPESNLINSELSSEGIKLKIRFEPRSTQSGANSINVAKTNKQTAKKLFRESDGEKERFLKESEEEKEMIKKRKRFNKRLLKNKTRRAKSKFEKSKKSEGIKAPIKLRLKLNSTGENVRNLATEVEDITDSSSVSREFSVGEEFGLETSACNICGVFIKNVELNWHILHHSKIRQCRVLVKNITSEWKVVS